MAEPHTQIRIAGIVNESVMDGPGIRLVVFAQGCRHHCPGCHNPHTHAFGGGFMKSIESIIDTARRNPLLDGVTLSGGDPFEQAEGFAELARRAKELSLHVMTYTGYTYEQLKEGCVDRPGWKELLALTDILVDGRYEHQQRNLLLAFRGSENQRLIDMKQTRLTNRITLV